LCYGIGCRNSREIDVGAYANIPAVVEAGNSISRTENGERVGIRVGDGDDDLAAIGVKVGDCTAGGACPRCCNIGGVSGEVDLEVEGCRVGHCVGECDGVG